MIRINLLAAPPPPNRPPPAGAGRVVTTVGAVFLAGALGLLLRDGLAMRSESTRLEGRLQVVDRQLARLDGIAAQREEVERRGADLARRVALVEALRAARGAPVRLMEQVGRVLPHDAWLTELRQQGDEVALKGRAAAMTGLTALVVGMESSRHFLQPIDIVGSRQEAGAVHFEVRARLSAVSP